MKIQLTPHQSHQPIPYDLLLLADPNQANIEAYLPKSDVYIAYNMAGNRVGACVITPLPDNAWEILNIVVAEVYHNQGVGKQMMTQIIALAQAQQIDALWVATGNSSIGQLAFYQKCGFEMHSTVPNYFIENYPEKIIEHGIVCKHQVRLVYYWGK